MLYYISIFQKKERMKTMEKVYLQMASYSMSGSNLDFEGQLALTGKMGYTGVEFAGSNYGGMNAEQLNATLKKYGIGAISAHVRLENVLKDLPLIKAVGCKYIIVASHYFTNEAETKALAAQMNEIGKKCREEGIWLGYHNHTAEFNTDGGKYLLEILIENTDPQYVVFQIDAGWAAAAGIDVIAFFKKHAGRIKLIHANESDIVIGPEKPHNMADRKLDENGRPVFSEEEMILRKKKNEADCPMGKGLLNWNEAIAVAREIGVEEYIVERRHSYAPELETSLKEDLEFLRKI